MSNPAPGTARIDGGPWLPCRFTLDGTGRYVDWSVDVDPYDPPSIGHAEIEIAICDGVTVYGSSIITDVRVSAMGNSATASGNGALRGTR